MSELLKDKVVVITGAGQGLGRAYALHAANAGASVVVNDLNGETSQATADAIRHAGGSAISCPGEVNAQGFGDHLMTQAIESFGRLDGVVPNAGVLNAASLFDETSEHARKTVETNLMGTIEVGLAGARALRAGGGGAIVLITSGSRFGLLESTTYGATKNAVASLCWGWALEAAPFGIRVNAVSPMAQTPMTIGNVIQTTLLPEEIAPAVTYFLSDLSVDVTGQIMRIYESGIGLYPEARLVPHEVPGRNWTTERVAEAMSTSLAKDLAPVGRSGELGSPAGQAR